MMSLDLLSFIVNVFEDFLLLYNLYSHTDHNHFLPSFDYITKESLKISIILLITKMLNIIYDLITN